jgi:small subunit ribosomal protein S18
MIKKKRKIKVPRNCFFCKEKIDPTFREVANLSRFMNDRGRIVGRDRSGTCAQHQRKLSTEIKRARHLALLPFTAGL